MICVYLYMYVYVWYVLGEIWIFLMSFLISSYVFYLLDVFEEEKLLKNYLWLGLCVVVVVVAAAAG